jgi:hypothetical protein
MPVSDQIPENSEGEHRSSESLDRRISEAEKAASFSRAFLEHLYVEDKELEERVEEIALSYERELDRLRVRKDRSGDPDGP